MAMYHSRLNPYSKPFEPSSSSSLNPSVKKLYSTTVPPPLPPAPITRRPPPSTFSRAIHEGVGGDQLQDDLGLRGLARVLAALPSGPPLRIRLSPLDLPLDDFFGHNETRKNTRKAKIAFRMESALCENRALAGLLSPYPVPEEYRVFSGRRTLHLPPMHPRLEEMKCDTLFFLFYAAPADLLQVAAAYALHRQRWCYHKVWRLWVRRPPRSSTVFATELMEKGLFEIFDVSKWQCVMGHFLLRYDDIAPLPACPSDMFEFYQQSQRGDLFLLPDASQMANRQQSA